MTFATLNVNLVLKNHRATRIFFEKGDPTIVKFNEEIAFDLEKTKVSIAKSKNLDESNVELTSRGMAKSMGYLVVANNYLTHARKLLDKEILEHQNAREQGPWWKSVVKVHVKHAGRVDGLITEAMKHVEAARSSIAEAAAMVADPNSPPDLMRTGATVADLMRFADGSRIQFANGSRSDA